MTVVSDTSPINYLILIQQVELLHALYERALVPPGVLEELTHAQAPKPVVTWVLARPEWFEVRVPKTLLDDRFRHFGLGEREVIALGSRQDRTGYSSTTIRHGSSRLISVFLSSARWPSCARQAKRTWWISARPSPVCSRPVFTSART